MSPKPKVAAAGVSGAVATIAVWLAGQFGIDMSAEVGAAFAVLVAFAGGYLKAEPRDVAEAVAPYVWTATSNASVSTGASFEGSRFAAELLTAASPTPESRTTPDPPDDEGETAA